MAFKKDVFESSYGWPGKSDGREHEETGQTRRVSLFQERILKVESNVFYNWNDGFSGKQKIIKMHIYLPNRDLLGDEKKKREESKNFDLSLKTFGLLWFFLRF